ncbi:hypothetical protein D3C84_1195750 [compost metagenome]
MRVAIAVFSADQVPKVATLMRKCQEKRQVFVVVINRRVANQLRVFKGLVDPCVPFCQELTEQSFLANLGQRVGHLRDAIQKPS